MKRFSFLTALFAPLGLAFQTQVKPNNLDTRNPPVTAIPLNVRLFGVFGNSFTQVRLGSGLQAVVRTGTGDPFIEIVVLPVAPLLPTETIIPATRVSNNRYSVTDTPTLANRTLKVYRNGLFMTPGLDYNRNGNAEVVFTTIVGDDDVITFVYSGV